MKAMRVHEAAEILNVSPSSVRRFIKEGRLKCSFTPGGQRVVTQDQIDEFLGVEKSESYAFYVRCSRGEKKNLESQIQKLTEAYGDPITVFSDKGSGLNENRKGLWRLISSAEKGEFTVLAITAKDRLTRFGFRYLEEYLKLLGVEIVILDDEREKSLQEELMQDFMSLIASFSGKFYKMRGIEQRKLLLKRAEESLNDRG